MKKSWLCILFYTYTLITLPLTATLPPLPQPTPEVKNERIAITEDFYIKALTPKKKSLLLHIYKHFQPKPDKYIHGIFNPTQLKTYIKWSNKDEDFIHNINNLISFVITNDNKAAATILTKKNDNHIFNIPFSFNTPIGTVQKKNGQAINTNTIVIVLTRSVKNNQQLKIKTIYPIEKKSTYDDAAHPPLKIKKHNNEELISYINKTLHKQDSSFNNDLAKFEKKIHNLENKLKKSCLNQKTEAFFASYHDFIASLATTRKQIVHIQNEIITISNNPQFHNNMNQLMSMTSNEETKYRQTCSHLKKKLKQETNNIPETRGLSTQVLKENIQATQEKIATLKNLYTTLLFIPQAEQAKAIFKDIMSRFNILQIQLEDITKDEKCTIPVTKPCSSNSILTKMPIWEKLYSIEKKDNYQALREMIIEQEILIHGNTDAAKIAELYDNAMHAICNLTNDKKIQSQIAKTFIKDLTVTQKIFFDYHVTQKISAPSFKNISSILLNFYAIGLELLTKQKYKIKFIKKIGEYPVVNLFCFLTICLSKNIAIEDILNQDPTTTLLTPFINENIAALKNLNLSKDNIMNWAISKLLETLTFDVFNDKKPQDLKQALKTIHDNSQHFFYKFQTFLNIFQDAYSIPFTTKQLDDEGKEVTKKILFGSNLASLALTKSFIPTGTKSFISIIENLIKTIKNIENTFSSITQTITQEEKITYQNMQPFTNHQEEMAQTKQTILATLDFAITLLREQNRSEACLLAGFCKKIFEYSPSTKIATMFIIELFKIIGQKKDNATAHALKLVRQLSHNQHESSAKHIQKLIQKPIKETIPSCSRIISFLQQIITTLASLKNENTTHLIAANTETIIEKLLNKNITKEKLYQNKKYFDAMQESIPNTIQQKIIKKIIALKTGV